MAARIALTFEQGTLVLRMETEADWGSVVDILPTSCVYDQRVRAFRAPGASYRELVTALARSSQVELVDHARAYARLDLQHASAHEPRPYQTESVASWREAGGRGVVVLPTGAGKSFVAELAMRVAGRATLVVTPTIDLMHQWRAGLSAAFSLDVGQLGGGVNDARELTVTTYDSAHIHMERIGNCFGFVIFDEVHHLPGPSYAFAARCCIAPYRLGLTATPERADGGDDLYDELVGPIVFRKRIKELVGTHLADYDVIQLEVDLSAGERESYTQSRECYLGFVRSRRIRMGGPNGWQQFLRETSRSSEGRRALLAYREQRRIAQGCTAKIEALGQLLRQHRDDRVLIFTHDNQTVYAISRRFLLPTLTHQTPPKERKEVLERFNAGRYPALVTSRVLNEGVNIPAANVAVVLSGTASVREHVQRLGRILRRKQDNYAILYEIVARGTNEEFVSERRRGHDAYR